MTIKANNSDARQHVLRKEDFEAFSIFGYKENNVYAVYSWGRHFPMYVFDYKASYWIGNSDGYSKSTSRHKSICKPPTVHTWVDTEHLKDIIYHNGVAGYVAKRLTHRRAA